ncbi:MAG: hypothetical protein KatS3mg129_2652 [Leptospiraceae bacterium]|nr:MAG: hypothetical protein KatS3mg129_2652 [Leptospiraceae bacterium]
MWVLFHKNCLDGTGSAAGVLKKFPDVQLMPISHSYSEMDLEPLWNTKNETIYVVDFSLRRNDFERLLKNQNKIIHIDHHITAKEDIEYLKKYENYISIFDINHSGAYLTWHYLFEEVPKLIYYIEDRDIWKKEFPETDVICYYLFGKVLDRPQELLQYLEKDIKEIYEKGLEIQSYMESNIQQTLEKIEPIWISVGKWFKKYKIPALNSTFYLSELGNELAKKYDGISCIFYISNYDVKMSFRSVEGTKLYAKDAAQYFGGGGHLHAAGAKISLKKFYKLIKD